MSDKELENNDDSDPNGAVHADLSGAASQFRFRTERLKVAALEFDSTCSFRIEMRHFAGIQVVDVSATGLGLETTEPLELEDGLLLEDVVFQHCGRTIWSGSAAVVYPQNGETQRFGIKFLGPPLSLQEIRFSDSVVEHKIGRTIERQAKYEQFLPADWRAKVMTFYNVMVDIRENLEEYERQDPDGIWREPSTSWRLCSAVFEKIWPAVGQLNFDLDYQAKGFNANQTELGLSFAQRIINLEFPVCEFLNRAYFKPQGYAGDYRMMELGQTNILAGDSLFARFLHYYSQHTPLGQTIKARAGVAYEAAKEVIALDRPVRIMSLACGPAVELRRLLADVKHFAHPVEILLVDQDEDALRSCVTELNRVIALRGDNPPVEFHCLHFSLRQIIAPKKGGEQKLVKEVLSNVDLVYSMGLFDYLQQKLARRTTSSLFNLLAPQGRLLIGNLCRVPESTWMMEYGVAWHLVYRNKEEMFDLGSSIEQQSCTVNVLDDTTGNCLFTDARRVD
jgi:SAM-dependent methyltransferase